MTSRLYYHDSFLYDFDARVLQTIDHQGRPAVVLDQTAFYPASGGQVFDTGQLEVGNKKLEVAEVAEDDNGTILHYTSEPLPEGQPVHGVINAARRRDHMQQHSGQHVLSAAFVRLFDVSTVSFHMGAESCTVDLAAKTLSTAQIIQAEELANQVVTEDRPVSIRFVSLDEARKLGVRKLPPRQSGELRLIDMSDFDLTACGGTHVRSTGQIGAILVRKTENVKQGIRVEFVCGMRAVAVARQDYFTLTEAAGLLSTHIRELPQQVRKMADQSKAAEKSAYKLLEELADLHADRLLAGNSGTPRVIVRVFPERDMTFIKLLAQKLTAKQENVIALLAGGAGQPALVFAQSPGGKTNMGQMMKELMARLGGRGGGTAEMAQGGLPPGSVSFSAIELELQSLAKALAS